MSKERIRITLAALLLALSAAAYGAKTPAPAPPTSTGTSGEVTVLPSTGDSDSRETREGLRELLRRYPPQLGMVLKLDPTLLNNQAYLATYPALAAFVAEHPAVAHNPGYFLAWIPSQEEQDTAGVRMWMDILGGVAGFSVFLIVIGVLAWLVKTIVDQRRWTQLSRIQTEVHNKLLDRFTSNEELLTYIQTPAGRRFLESAPIPLEASPRPISAPVGRILWSVQVGLVVAAAGIGLQVVSFQAQKEIAPVLSAIGLVSICVGIAFVVSAVVSYALSKKLGLWAPPQTES